MMLKMNIKIRKKLWLRPIRRTKMSRTKLLKASMIKEKEIKL